MKKSALSLIKVNFVQVPVFLYKKKEYILNSQGSVKALNAKNARLSDGGVSRRKSVPARSSIPPISCMYIVKSFMSGFEWELHLCIEGTLKMHAALFSLECKNCLLI